MRHVVLGLGFLALAGVWLGPLPQLAPRAFAAHMIMHMGVVAVAAPLIAVGLSGGRFDPVRYTPRLFAPIPASVLELVVVWAWHAPALHHVARHSTAGLIAEQGMFLFSGLLVWLAAFGGNDYGNGSRRAAGVVGLLLTSMHMTLLGVLLALPARPLYTHTAGVSGLTPLEDQQLGGAIMLAVGGISYLLGGLWLTGGLVRKGAKYCGLRIADCGLRRGTGRISHSAIARPQSTLALSSPASSPLKGEEEKQNPPGLDGNGCRL